MPRFAYGPDRSGYDCVITWNSRMACVASPLRMSCWARVKSLVARAGGFGMFQAGAAGATGVAVCEFATAGLVGSAGVGIVDDWGGGASCTGGGGGAAGTSASKDALIISVLP